MEYNENLVPFVDQEKTFDRVHKKILWKTIAQYGVSKHLIGLCKNLYNDCRSVVKTNQGTLEPFTITSGVKQGCVLSQLLFLSTLTA